MDSITHCPWPSGTPDRSLQPWCYQGGCLAGEVVASSFSMGKQGGIIGKTFIKIQIVFVSGASWHATILTLHVFHLIINTLKVDFLHRPRPPHLANRQWRRIWPPPGHAQNIGTHHFNMNYIISSVSLDDGSLHITMDSSLRSKNKWSGYGMGQRV